MNIARLHLTLAAFSLLPLFLSAQVNERFDDGDLDRNPSWTGTSGSWLVNSSHQLQSNHTTANGTFYITTASTLARSAQWDFSITLNFNTSSANYADVYLTASDSALANNKTSGYFVRIGNTDDEIALYRKDPNGGIKKIIDGGNGVTNTSSSRLRIRVYRDEFKEFHLFYENTGSGSYTNLGSVIDSTYTTSAYFGFLVRQSTSTFFQKHYFDDIVVQPYKRDTTGSPGDPDSNDIVINEILFNPRPDAFDYIELYNRSNKTLDATQLYIGNRNSTGAIGSIKKLSGSPLYIQPGGYLVVTEDASSLQQSYFVKHPEYVLAMPSLPSYPNEKGTVVLLNAARAVLDEVAYSKDWHFSLIADDEGVALERIDPDALTQNKGNWHSAASTAGYGTPTYRNSQYKQTEQVNAVIEVTPRVFSPDNDGYEDIATINYQLSENGYVANILIFDAAGRLVCSLVKNGISGLKGSWKWEGLDDKKQRLPIGTYIIYTELFNLKGKKKQFKNAVVLARKLN